MIDADEKKVLFSLFEAAVFPIRVRLNYKSEKMAKFFFHSKQFVNAIARQASLFDVRSAYSRL